jgi:hypothetical protein
MDNDTATVDIEVPSLKAEMRRSAWRSNLGFTAVCWISSALFAVTVALAIWLIRTRWSACVLEFTDKLDVFISAADLIFWSGGLLISLPRHLLGPELSARVMNTLMLAGLRPVEIRG